MILNKFFFPPLLVPGVESRSYPRQQVIYHWVISPIPIFIFFFEIDRVSECLVWPWIYDLPVWASHIAGITVCAPGSSLTILKCVLVCACATVLVVVRGQLVGASFLLSPCRSGIEQVIRLGGKWLYLPSHLTAPLSSILTRISLSTVWD